MKSLCYIYLFFCFMIIGCKKNEPISVNVTLPFENDNLKIALVSTSIPSSIRDIFFFNTSTGIAVSYDGKIYKTINNGVNWSLQYASRLNQPFYQILFTDENVGYVVGGSNNCSGTGCIPSGGLILKTIDGGNTWATISQLPSGVFISIAANSLGNLFAISNGTKGRIHKSTDAGISWTIIDSVNFQLQKINFSSGFGFCTGMGGKRIRSSDNGEKWDVTTTLMANYATDIKFSNVNGFCIADNQIVYKTTDNGNNWVQTLINQNGCYVLNPLTANSCISFGAAVYSGGDFGTWSAKIMQTTNAGSSWTNIQLNEIESIRYTSFYSSTEGYAVAGTKLLKVTVK